MLTSPVHPWLQSVPTFSVLPSQLSCLRTCSIDARRFSSTSFKRFRRRRVRKHQPSPLGHERDIRCNNYWTVLFRFFRNGSSGATSTISSQSRKAGRWALDHYRHKRQNKMRYPHKEVREPFNKAQCFGCRLEDRGKNVVIFPHAQTVQSDIARNEVT